MNKRDGTSYETCSLARRVFIDTMVQSLGDKDLSMTRAGLGGKYQMAEAGRLMRINWVRAAIAERTEDYRAANEQAIIRDMSEIAFRSDIADFDGLADGVTPRELRAGGVNTRLIKTLQVDTTTRGTGDGKYTTTRCKYELYSRKAALDVLARIRGLDKQTTDTGNTELIEGLLELAKMDRGSRTTVQDVAQAPALKVVTAEGGR